MKALLTILASIFLPIVSMAQYVSSGFNGGASYTIYAGNTVYNGNHDSNNGGFAVYQPFLTPPYPSTVSSATVYSPSIASGTWGVAIYTDNGHTPQGGTKLCGNTSTSASNGFNTLALSGCGTLSPNTEYWSAQYTSNNAWQEGWSANTGSCAGNSADSLSFSSASITPWPSTAAAVDLGTSQGCYAQYVTLNIQTTDPYVIIQSGGFGNTSSTTTGSTATIPPITAGHSLVVMTMLDPSAVPATGVTDATNGTTNDTLTKRGTCSGVTSGFQLCFYTIDRATVGANQIIYTITTVPSVSSMMFAEIAGTLSSSSFDTSEYDTSYKTTQAFTSGATSTTSRATEILIGGVVNASTYTPPAPSVAYYSFSGNWKALPSGTSGNAGSFTFFSGLAYQIVNVTGAYSLTGTWNDNSQAIDSLPAIVTLR